MHYPNVTGPETAPDTNMWMALRQAELIVPAPGAVRGAHTEARAPPARPSVTFASPGGELVASAYLPGPGGFYRGTRFEQPMVHSLRLGGARGGHNYYGAWFNASEPCAEINRSRPDSCDFVFAGPERIVAGPCSAATGPVDAFGAVGWAAAACYI